MHDALGVIRVLEAEEGVAEFVDEHGALNLHRTAEDWVGDVDGASGLPPDDVASCGHPCRLWIVVGDLGSAGQTGIPLERGGPCGRVDRPEGDSEEEGLRVHRLPLPVLRPRLDDAQLTMGPGIASTADPDTADERGL